MFRIILIYGGIAGLVVISAITSGLVFQDTVGFLASEWVGYLIMLVAFSMIFVGIKRYRDIERGGVVGFGRAFALGVGISAFAGIVYVTVWEAYLMSSNYAFISDYVASAIDGHREAGLTGAALDREIATLQDLEQSYMNPLFRLPLTFLEIFPVGLVVSLVSAAVLRKSEVLPAQN